MAMLIIVNVSSGRNIRLFPLISVFLLFSSVTSHSDYSIDPNINNFWFFLDHFLSLVCLFTFWQLSQTTNPQVLFYFNMIDV